MQLHASHKACSLGQQAYLQRLCDMLRVLPNQSPRCAAKAAHGSEASRQDAFVLAS